MKIKAAYLRCLRGGALAAALILSGSAVRGAKPVVGGDGARGAAVPQESWVVQHCSLDSMKRLIATSAAMPLHGIWEATADGATVAVVPGRVAGGAPSHTGSSLIVILYSPRSAFRCGTVAGWCTPSAKNGSFDCYLFTDHKGATLTRPRRFTLSMADADHLSVVPVREGLEFKPLRLLPYMYRTLFVERHDRDRTLDGFLRLFPEPTTRPLTPRYL